MKRRRVCLRWNGNVSVNKKKDDDNCKKKKIITYNTNKILNKKTKTRVNTKKTE